MIGVLRPRKSAMNASSLTSSGSTPPGIKSARMNAQLAEHPRIDKPQFASRSQLGDEVRVLCDLVAGSQTTMRPVIPRCTIHCAASSSDALPPVRRAGFRFWP